MARLEHGRDLLEQMREVAEGAGVQMAYLGAIGALQDARLAFYDQSTHRYEAISIDQPAEIASCIGNLTKKDGQPFIHAHAVLALSDGRVMGGHLVGGSVFAAELYIQELMGTQLERRLDSTTGLYLW